jgi:hypothetical protein
MLQTHVSMTCACTILGFLSEIHEPFYPLEYNSMQFSES